MVFLKFTVLVCSLGTVFGQLNVEIISQKIEIFDKELVQEDLKIVEDDNGHPALDGTLTTTKPVGEDYMLSVTVFRNPGNIKILSKKQNSVEIMNGIYKKHFMETFHKCSDLPYFEDKWEPPFEAKTYQFNKCTIPDADEYSKATPTGKFRVLVEGLKGDEKVGTLEVEFEVKK